MEKLRSIIKKEAIEKVERHVSTYKPFESIIDIYVDMRLEQIELERQLLKQSESTNDCNILSQILADLKSDISKYEKQLLIN